jgi:hypothetical protein
MTLYTNAFVSFASSCSSPSSNLCNRHHQQHTWFERLFGSSQKYSIYRGTHFFGTFGYSGCQRRHTGICMIVHQGCTNQLCTF